MSDTANVVVAKSTKKNQNEGIYTAEDGGEKSILGVAYAKVIRRRRVSRDYPEYVSITASSTDERHSLPPKNGLRPSMGLSAVMSTGVSSKSW